MNFTNPNRREFLEIAAGAAVSALALSACAPSSLTNENLSASPSELFPLPEEKDITTDFEMLGYGSPEAKAAFEHMGGWEGRFHVSPSKYVNGGSIAFVDGGWGQLMELSGRYFITTLPHVVENAGYMQELVMHMPNIGFIKAERPFWYSTPYDGSDIDDNYHYYFPLTKAVSKYIKAAERQKKIAPVRPTKFLPKHQEILGMLVDEDTKFYNGESQDTFSYLTATDYWSSWNRIVADVTNGESTACNYSSGESIYRLVEKNGRKMLTGEVYGSLTGYSGMNKLCVNKDIIIKPFYNFDLFGRITN